MVGKYPSAEEEGVHICVQGWREAWMVICGIQQGGVGKYLWTEGEVRKVTVDLLTQGWESNFGMRDGWVSICDMREGWVSNQHEGWVGEYLWYEGEVGG